MTVFFVSPLVTVRSSDSATDFCPRILFATRCTDPTIIDVPTNVPGAGTLWSGIDAFTWLSPYFPLPAASFNYETGSALTSMHEGERLDAPLLILFAEQEPAPVLGSILHAHNEQVTKVFGKLPLKWKGNVLVLRTAGRGTCTLADTDKEDLIYAKGVMRS
ncbi:hypothetical protein B0H13DRAFT_1917588 [Mycena leptocephala]|nr:hypothetical protein B0H13DRAFT_1917588 [Mycena leptocephala]